MRGGNRSGAGRKAIPIDLLELEKLSALQCTVEEIAAWFRVTARTIANRRERDPEFRDVMERGRAMGRISVRRSQMKLMDGGNAAMGIWLGKQLLGQRDLTPLELGGPDGDSLKLSLEVIDEILSEAKKKSRGKRNN